MVHGIQHRTASPSASAGRVIQTQPLVPESAFRPERYAAQPRRNGSSEPSDGLVISVKPHSKPYAHQPRRRCDSESSRVAHSSDAPNSAASEVSQIHSNGIMTALGNNAQSHAAPLATPTPATFFPT